MFNILGHKGNANQNIEIPSSSSPEWQNGTNKTNNNKCWQGFRQNMNPYTLVVGM
jgi:hypothetical protein